MYEEIIENLKIQLSEEKFNEILNRKMHLGIFSEPYLSYMLSGRKTIESRFSKAKIIPYDRISKDDIVIVKKSSKDVVAYFTIADVKFFDLNTTSIDEIKKIYNDGLCLDNEFWAKKRNSNYATLIFIKALIILKPFHIDKKGMQTWLELRHTN